MTIDDEQRERFENAGVDLVRMDLINGGRRVIHDNGDLSKDRIAAKEWIAEKNKNQANIEKRRFWMVLIVSAVAAIASVWGLFIELSS